MMRLQPLARICCLTSKCMAFHTTSSLFAIQYNVDHYYEPYKASQYPDDIPPPMHRYLADIDPISFPSRSQARRAIQHGRLIVLRDDESTIVNQTTTLQDDDILAIRSRVANECYPQSYTKYVEPPSSYANIQQTDDQIIYEDEHIAVVNKPEGLTTIGEKRLDLQSVLPFIVHPPPSLQHNNYLPRPIHRLDRGTSGCVLVAKSELAMKKFSIMFANRKIQKSYCAVVFGKPKQDEDQRCIDVGNNNMYSTIDYPIDGKEALTLWRVLRTVESPTWGTLSLLHLKPKTGRYHQIRRHLSYCLSCPIVGDTKYDGGSTLAKESRKLGMFLCSNSIQFNHVLFLEDMSTVSVNIHLPDKFYELLNLDKDDVLI